MEYCKKGLKGTPRTYLDTPRSRMRHMSIEAVIGKIEEIQLENFAKKVIRRNKAIFDRLARM